MKVVTFGELMLRLEPEGFYRFVQVDRLTATFGGAEANVAVSLANFGLDSCYVTKLPEHEIGQSAYNFLRRFGVNTQSSMHLSSWSISWAKRSRAALVLNFR